MLDCGPTAATCADPYPTKLCLYIMIVHGGFCPHFTALTYVLFQMPPQAKWLQLSGAECGALDQIWFVLFKSPLCGSFPHKAGVSFAAVA